MRVLVCGDRHWNDREFMILCFSKLLWKDVRVIIHGDAQGADKLAGDVAKKFGKYVESFPADWNTYGKAAGPIRNQRMLDDGKPDLVVAFHDDLEHSKGTKDMVTRAKKAKIPVKVFSHEDVEHE